MTYVSKRACAGHISEQVTSVPTSAVSYGTYVFEKRDTPPPPPHDEMV